MTDPEQKESLPLQDVHAAPGDEFLGGRLLALQALTQLAEAGLLLGGPGDLLVNVFRLVAHGIHLAGGGYEELGKRLDELGIPSNSVVWDYVPPADVECQL